MTSRLGRRLAAVLSLLALGICLGASVLVFLGRITEGTYKTAFLAASIAWFVFSIARGSSANRSADG
jgi:hypothetical protein